MNHRVYTCSAGPVSLATACDRKIPWRCPPPAAAARAPVQQCSHTDRRQCLLAPVLGLAAAGALQLPARAAFVDDDTAADIFEASSMSCSAQQNKLKALVVLNS